MVRIAWQHTGIVCLQNQGFHEAEQHIEQTQTAEDFGFHCWSGDGFLSADDARLYR